MAGSNGPCGRVVHDILVVAAGAAAPGGVRAATRPEPVVAAGWATGGVATSSGVGAHHTRDERCGGDDKTVVVGAGCGVCDWAAVPVGEGVAPTGDSSIVTLAAPLPALAAKDKRRSPPPDGGDDNNGQPSLFSISVVGGACPRPLPSAPRAARAPP